MAQANVYPVMLQRYNCIWLQRLILAQKSCEGEGDYDG